MRLNISAVERINMNYFNEYGLTGPVDPTSENGELFLVQYLFLLDMHRMSPDNEAITCMLKLLDATEVEPGLFHRNPYLTTRTTSNDNLTAIMAFSKHYNTEHKYRVATYLIKHFGTYDNTRGSSKQLSRLLPFNPGNFFIWLTSAGYTKSALIFLPFYFTNLIIACNKPYEDTSTKLLHWVGLYPLKTSQNWLMKHINKYYEAKMTKMYGSGYISNLMDIYHGGQDGDFPINKIIPVPRGNPNAAEL